MSEHTLYSMIAGVKPPRHFTVYDKYNDRPGLSVALASLRGEEIRSVILIQGRILIEFVDSSRVCLGVDKDIKIEL